MNCKFAILAIPKIGWFPNIDFDQILGQNLLLLADPQMFLKSLPENYWKSWIGTIEWENLIKTETIILSWCPTKTPDILDHENKAMEDFLAGPVHSALTLIAPFPGTGGRPILLSGSGEISNGTVIAQQIRSFSSLSAWARPRYSLANETPFFWQWMEATYPLASIIREWSALIAQLQQLPDDDAFYLYRMALSMFKQALSDVYLDFKFPNFVRSIETLVAIPKTAVLKKTYGNSAAIEFRKRICRFYPNPSRLFFSMTTSELSRRAEEIYQLRSDSVHGKPLAWTLKQQNAGFTEDELFRYEFIVETAARTLLVAALSTPKWMSALRDRDCLEAAWLAGIL